MHDLGKGAYGVASLIVSFKDDKFKVRKVVLLARLKTPKEQKQAYREVTIIKHT